MRKILFLLLPLAFSNCKNDQQKTTQAGLLQQVPPAEHLDRYEQEIQAFELADNKQMPPQGAVLFAGSSSIRLWEMLAQDFAPTPVINRGFGGSTLPEVLNYAGRVVFKYKPKLIVLYCGENDMAESAPPATAFQNLKKFIGETEKNLPGTPVLYISAKPSPARWELWKKYGQFNEMVKQFDEARPDLHFVDIGGTLLTASGEPDPSLFAEDKLHLNKAGYAKWATVLKPLVEELYTTGKLQ